jgi:tetratricopeptide (TPR) repeat protein
VRVNALKRAAVLRAGLAALALLLVCLRGAAAADGEGEVLFFALENPKKDYGFSKKVNALDADGIGLIAKKKFAEAIKRFDASLKEMPKNPRALANRGVCEQSLKNYGAAIADFTAALKIAPELAPLVSDPLGRAYLDRGRGRIDARDGDGAMSDYRLSLQFRSGAKQAPSYSEIAYLWSLARDYTKCIAAATKAITSDPGFADGWSNRAACRITGGRPEDALGDLDRAIELQPANPQPYISRATAYQILGRCREARADRDKIVALDPKYADMVAGVSTCKDSARPAPR